MIDIENTIFNIIKDALIQKYPNIVVLGEYVRKVPKFPCVFIIELNNSVIKSYQDDKGVERYANVSYQVDVFTSGQGKKQQSKNIMNVINEEMANLLFTRDFLQYLTNLENDQLCRLTARYQAIVSHDYRIYNNR